MQLNLMIPKAPGELLEQLNDTKALVSETVQEVRTLSKTLNYDVIVKNGLLASVEVEIGRFNKLQFLKANLEVIGEEIALPNEHDIIMFRILQEFFSNVIKHAKAKKLFVLLDYQLECLKIIVEDDGVGFNMNIQSQNSGLETMKNRAALIHASFDLKSSVGNGTKLELNYPYLYAQDRKA
jgi:signal transduction histidine kinase